MASDVCDDQPSKPLVSVLPDLAIEIERLLRIQGESDLAVQVAGLRILDRCRCGDRFCSTFYVQPKPEGAYGPSHRNIDLEAASGMLLLDVVDEEIACIEVLNRDEIRERLNSIFPLLRWADFDRARWHQFRQSLINTCWETESERKLHAESHTKPYTVLYAPAMLDL